HRIPGRHPRREMRTSTDVASAADPIDIVVRASELQPASVAFHEEVRAAWKEARRDTSSAFDMRFAAQMAGFAADAERHGILRRLPIGHGILNAIAIVQVHET